MGRRIEVVPHDPSWAVAFEREAADLTAVFGASLLDIHHVGSTSVPGLVAKPVVDILAVLREGVDVSRFDEPLSRLGYRVRGECLDAGGTPGRYYFSKPPSGTRTHHLHVCHAGHFQITEMIRFPQYLKEHPDAAAEYGRIKRAAAVRHEYDNVAYMASKHAWIRSTIRRAVACYGDVDPDQVHEG